MKKLITILIVLLIFSSTFFVSAEEPQTLTKKKTIETSDKSYIFDFDKEFILDNIKYKFEDVNYNISKIGEDKKHATKEIVLNDLLKKEDAKFDESYTENSIDYTLDNVTYIDTQINGRKASLFSTINLKTQISQPQVPEQKPIEYMDGVTKEVVKGDLNFNQIKQVTDYNWLDNITIPTTFIIYQAKYYVIEDAYVPYNDVKPALKGYEYPILQHLKADPNSYRIDDMNWKGDVYEKDGILYRDAEVLASQFVADYVANYTGTVSLPPAKGYTAVATYIEEADVMYSIEATATYVEVLPILIPTPKDEILKKILVITGAILLISICLILIFYVLARRRKRTTNKGRK